MAAKTFWIRDFSGGLNAKYSQNRIADNESPACRNARWNRAGALTKRLGTVRTSITGSGAIQSIFPHAGSTTERLLISDGDQVDSVNNSLGGLTSLITGLNNEWPPEFLYFNSNVYITNGNDTVRKVTTAEAVSTIAAYPVARFHVVHKGYVFTLNQDAAGLRTRLQWSNYGDAETYTSTNFEDIAPLNNMVGLGLYSFGDELIIFLGPNNVASSMVYTTGRMFRLMGDIFDASNPTYILEEIPLPPNVGLLGHGHRTIQAMRGMLIFMSNDGPYSYTGGGSMPMPIGDQLRNQISGWEKADINTAGKMAAATVWKNQYWCSIYKSDISNDVYDNWLYVLDENGKWWVDLIDPALDSFVTGGSTGGSWAYFNNKLYGCSSGSNMLREWDVTATFTETLDAGTVGAVNFSFLTKEFDFQTPQRFIRCWVHLKRQSSGTLTFYHNVNQTGAVSASLDMTAPDTGTDETASSNILRKLVDIGKIGRTIQFRPHDLGANDLEIYAIELEHENA